YHTSWEDHLEWDRRRDYIRRSHEPQELRIGISPNRGRIAARDTWAASTSVGLSKLPAPERQALCGDANLRRELLRAQAAVFPALTTLGPLCSGYSRFHLCLQVRCAELGGSRARCHQRG